MLARDWRRAILTALTGAMLACSCPIGSHAQSGGEPDAEESKGHRSKASARKRQDPIEAQRSVESALEQLQAGRAERAIQALSATLAGGNLPPAIMAKALLVRGMAYRQQGQPAQAISDLTSALWLKGGLGDDDRTEAMRERSAAYAAAGLRDPGDVAAGPAPKTASSGNWLSNLLGGGNLFGASSTSAPPPSSNPRPPPQAVSSAETTAPRTTAAISDAWSSDRAPGRPSRSRAPVESHKSRAQPERAHADKAHAAARPPPAPARSAAPSKPAEGRYLIQLAAVRTEAEALALAAKAKRAHASLLKGLGQTVDRHVFGNMGAFYRARLGPFSSAQETKSVCAKLQGSGIDCLPVTR